MWIQRQEDTVINAHSIDVHGKQQCEGEGLYSSNPGYLA